MVCVCVCPSTYGASTDCASPTSSLFSFSSVLSVKRSRILCWIIIPSITKYSGAETCRLFNFSSRRGSSVILIIYPSQFLPVFLNFLTKIELSLVCNKIVGSFQRKDWISTILISLNKLWIVVDRRCWNHDDRNFDERNFSRVIFSPFIYLPRWDDMGERKSSRDNFDEMSEQQRARLRNLFVSMFIGEGGGKKIANDWTYCKRITVHKIY